MRLAASVFLLALPLLCANSDLSRAHLAGISAEADTIAQVLRAHGAADARPEPAAVAPTGAVDVDALRAKVRGAMEQAARRAQDERVRMLMARIRAIQAAHQPQSAPPGLSDAQRRGVFSLIFRQPRLFVEVVRVDRRLAVDAENRPTALLGADVHRAVYRLQSGRLQRIAAVDTALRPRGAAGLRGFAADGRTPLARLRADVTLSLLLGLAMTCVIFAAAYVAAKVYERRRARAYDHVLAEPVLVPAAKEQPGDGLLSREERRAVSAAPALPL